MPVPGPTMYTGAEISDGMWNDGALAGKKKERNLPMNGQTTFGEGESQVNMLNDGGLMEKE